MGKKTVVILFVISLVLSVCSLIAVCAALLVGDEDIPPSSSVAESGLVSSSVSHTTQNIGTTKSFDGWNDDYLSSSRQTEKASTTTAKPITTTSTTRSSATRNSTTESTTTTKTTARKTTRTATQKEKDMLYDAARSKIMNEYNKYKTERLAYIAYLDAQIKSRQDTIDALYAEFEREAAKYPSESSKISIYNTFQNRVAPYGAEISALEAEKAQVLAALEQSEGELDAIINAEYLAAVEDFQQKTLS